VQLLSLVIEKIVHEIARAFQLPIKRTQSTERKTKHIVRQSKQRTTSVAEIKKTPAAMARVFLLTTTDQMVSEI